MSNVISHDIAKDGIRLPFTAGVGITYADDGTTTYRGKAVTQSANATAVLCADGDRVLGAIEVVEPPDLVGTRIGVHVQGVVTFINSGAAAAVTPGAAIVGAANGDVRDAVPSTDALANDGPNARGLVTQVVPYGSGEMIHVLF